jgi:hypothetical protein
VRWSSGFAARSPLYSLGLRSSEAHRCTFKAGTRSLCGVERDPHLLHGSEERGSDLPCPPSCLPLRCGRHADGLALSAMILTAVADFLKVYLARTSQAAHSAATKVPKAIKAPRGFSPARLFRRKGHARPKASYHGFSSPPGGRWRRWFLLVGRSVVAAAISFVLALGVVTAVEHSAGKSLSCWVWEECPTQSSSEEGADTSVQSTTRPSILGGGSIVGSNAASGGLRPAGPQQQLTPEPSASSSQAPSQAAGPQGSSPGAGDRWQEPSDRQQDSYYYYSEEYEQQSSSSPPSTTDEAQWREYQGGGSQYVVPWST